MIETYEDDGIYIWDGEPPTWKRLATPVEAVRIVLRHVSEKDDMIRLIEALRPFRKEVETLREVIEGLLDGMDETVDWPRADVIRRAHALLSKGIK